MSGVGKVIISEAPVPARRGESPLYLRERLRWCSVLCLRNVGWLMFDVEGKAKGTLNAVKMGKLSELGLVNWIGLDI